jgi:predicted NBD/HSP70 family sugar kinase
LAVAVIRMAKDRLSNAALTTARELALLARAGNMKARSIFEIAGQALPIAITDFVATLNFPPHPLGGGVCEARDLLSCQIFRKLECGSNVYQLKKPDELDPRASGRAKHT